MTEQQDDAVFDAATAMSRLFTELVLQLVKSEALSEVQVAEILVSNERLIGGLRETDQPKAALLHQAVHDGVLERLGHTLTLKPHIDRLHRQYRKPAND